MAKEDDDLRRRAERLLQSRKREPEPEVDSVAPEREESEAPRKKHRDYKSLATQGASGAALVTVVIQLLQARVSPEQLNNLRERVQAIEDERSARRLYEYERDKIEICRNRQQDEALQRILPAPDRQVSPPPKPWFDQCPEPREPTTGSTAAKAKQ